MALAVKNTPAKAGGLIRDVGPIPGLGRSPGGGHGNPLQYSCLENPMDWGAWHFKNWNFLLLSKSWKIWCFWACLPSWQHPEVEPDCTCIWHSATVSSLPRCLTPGLLHMVPWNWKASCHSPLTASFSTSKIIRLLLELQEMFSLNWEFFFVRGV